MMQEVEVLKTIPELVCSYFSEEQFTLSVSDNLLLLRSLRWYNNSNGLPILSPKIAPYIYASNPRITPAPLFLCYNMSIIEWHLYMVAVPATILR